jgi:hypothetical protein
VKAGEGRFDWWPAFDCYSRTGQHDPNDLNEALALFGFVLLTGTAGLLGPHLLHGIPIYYHGLTVAQISHFGFTALGVVKIARRNVGVSGRFIDFVSYYT